jgi:hypothetical protein
MQDDKTTRRMTKVQRMSDGSFQMDENPWTKISTAMLKVIAPWSARELRSDG